jgi:hypothetical protein
MRHTAAACPIAATVLAFPQVAAFSRMWGARSRTSGNHLIRNEGPPHSSTDSQVTNVADHRSAALRSIFKSQKGEKQNAAITLIRHAASLTLAVRRDVNPWQ